jgi:hypothetical protein
MGILDMTNYSSEDIPTGKVHPEGTEVRIRVTNITQGTDKNGVPYIMPWFEDADDANVLDFADYLPLPTAEDTAKKKGQKLDRIEAFSKCVDFPILGVQADLDQCKGQTGFVIVKLGEDNNGVAVNKVKKYVTKG